uniref:START domain-containing protein n=1 Tax=Plectus sambesii TaxID=2011161 RepID=A0A914XJ31_9BILA
MFDELYGVSETLINDTEENRTAYKAAFDALKESVELFDSKDYKTKNGWKKEAEDQGDVVYSKYMSYGKLFALHAELNISPEELFKDQWEGVEQLPEWNTNVEEGKNVAPLGSQSDITYQAMTDMMIIKGRDFVGSRIWRKIGDSYLLIGTGVVHSLMPERKGKVRGFLHLGAGKFSPVPGDPSKTSLEYLMSMEFKGIIPKAIINTVTARMMIADVALTRKHIEDITKEEKEQS